MKLRPGKKTPGTQLRQRLSDDRRMRPGAEETVESRMGVTEQGGGPSVVPALSILWHPDPDRVGEIHPLTLVPDHPQEIARLAPLFTPGGGGPARPLADNHLSRSAPALRIASDGRGRLRLSPGEGTRPPEVYGAPLERPTVIEPAEIEAGVVITLARRIVLCLHRVQLPLVRGAVLGLIGHGDGIEKVRQLVRRVADLDVPVLLRGETGSGKEMVARALVQASQRAEQPLISVNMAAISPTTAVAELFGHERGAFTGASGAREGYFGDAAGGTLFMDEVGLTPAGLQPMLLRVLETGEVMPVGGTRPRRVNVRVVSATDADLEAQMADRAFLEPLFHRLAGFQIVLPPLRHRREDFGSLLLHFLRGELAAIGELDRLRVRDDVPETTPWLSASQVARLAMGSWPGNVRALRNAVRQIVISSRGEGRARIDDRVEQLMDARGPRTRAHLTMAATPVPGAHPLPPVERPVAAAPAAVRGTWELRSSDLLKALRENHWKPGATAAALQIPRTTLYALMERHPGIRKASDIPADELLSQLEACGGDLDRAAEQLQVSRRGLQLRLAQISSAAPPA
jgi:two-component system nitrogen regulation response regulator GlnG